MLKLDRKKLLKDLQRETQYYSAHTKSQYTNHVIDYLAFVGPKDWKDREVLYSYIAKLQKQGFSQSYINYLVRGPIGSIFRMEGLRLPVKLPRVQPAVFSQSDEIFFQAADIEKMIKVAKKGTLEEQWLVAIATTYGPRVAEIRRIAKENVLCDKGIIIIYTVKHNLKRQHLIPKAIREIVFGYQYPELSTDTMYDTLYSIIGRAKVERKPRQSFHAIRHTLINELSFAGATPEQIYDYVGWIKPGTLGFYPKPLTFKPDNDKKIESKIHWLQIWGH